MINNLPQTRSDGKGFHRYNEIHSFNAKLPKGSKGISPVSANSHHINNINQSSSELSDEFSSLTEDIGNLSCSDNNENNNNSNNNELETNKPVEENFDEQELERRSKYGIDPDTELDTHIIDEKNGLALIHKPASDDNPESFSIHNNDGQRIWKQNTNNSSEAHQKLKELIEERQTDSNNNPLSQNKGIHIYIESAGKPLMR